MWLPTYTIAELTCQMFRLKSGLYADHVFRQLIHDALEIQRSETAKIKKKRIIGNIKNISLIFLLKIILIQVFSFFIGFFQPKKKNDLTVSFQNLIYEFCTELILIISIILRS